jgi:hypothetical protein
VNRYVAAHRQLRMKFDADVNRRSINILNAVSGSSSTRFGATDHLDFFVFNDLLVFGISGDSKKKLKEVCFCNKNLKKKKNSKIRENGRKNKRKKKNLKKRKKIRKIRNEISKIMITFTQVPLHLVWVMPQDHNSFRILLPFIVLIIHCDSTGMDCV